jgi:cytochrome b involved in lipid metabolism
MLGELKTSMTTPSPTTAETLFISRAELAVHNSPDNCWVVYNRDSVYDMSSYGHPSPPGQSVVIRTCGKDGSDAYKAVYQPEHYSRWSII